MINLIQIEQGESVNAVIPVQDFEGDQYLFFATRQGVVKKTRLDDYTNIRKGGLIAINMREDDELIQVKLTDGKQDIIMGTAYGMSIRFNENNVRSMGRSATGVKGITLDEGDRLVGMDLIQDDLKVLIVTAKGYGKRTPGEEYRLQTRGGKGIKTMNVTDKNGELSGLKVVGEDDDLMIITTSGTLIRMGIETISTMGRNTQGVRLIHIRDEDSVATVCITEKSEEPKEDELEETNADGTETTEASAVVDNSEGSDDALAADEGDTTEE
ncbi:DNA gyrase C-terminal beta-propeller domain-containing protein [Paenibacillus sp. WLX2291]|uniref:DNA gyrase C-terminal beta-propeller domain-containing protein n=1 Tax=Paenibacillus sp. WLX2291 TaxID=3296934 RepID=UPI00398457C4